MQGKVSWKGRLLASPPTTHPTPFALRYPLPRMCICADEPKTAKSDDLEYHLTSEVTSRVCQM